MQGRLTGHKVAWIDVTVEPPLVDAGNLVGEEGRAANVIVNAGETQDDGRN